MTIDLNDILPVRKLPHEEERHLNMTIKVLEEQVKVFTSRLEPHDTGNLHTTISTLTHRITELQMKKKKNRLTEGELAYIDECGHWAGTADDHPDNCYVQLELELDEEDEKETGR